MQGILRTSWAVRSPRRVRGHPSTYLEVRDLSASPLIDGRRTSQAPRHCLKELIPIYRLVEDLGGSIVLGQMKLIRGTTGDGDDGHFVTPFPKLTDQPQAVDVGHLI